MSAVWKNVKAQASVTLIATYRLNSLFTIDRLARDEVKSNKSVISFPSGNKDAWVSMLLNHNLFLSPAAL